MKTLINKQNPAIRITAPEIEEYEHFYSIPNWYGYNKSDWTLVEEEPEFEHRRKDTIYFLETAKTHYADTSELEKCIEWLKGLQPTEGIKGNLEEIPSMDLEKEIDKTVSECTNGYDFDWDKFARHFYEIGRKARKEK